MILMRVTGGDLAKAHVIGTIPTPVKYALLLEFAVKAQRELQQHSFLYAWDTMSSGHRLVYPIKAQRRGYVFSKQLFLQIISHKTEGAKWLVMNTFSLAPAHWGIAQASIVLTCYQILHNIGGTNSLP